MSAPRTIVLLSPLLLAFGTNPAHSLDATTCRAVTLEIAELLEQRYVDAPKATKVGRTLRREAGRSCDADSGAFARALTERLRALSQDGHLAVDYREPGTIDALEDTAAKIERWYGAHVNHGFEAVRRLDEGIGYLDVRVFAPVNMAGDLAAAAMSLLAESPALIIDLRRNGGGMGEMVNLLAAYLFDASVETSGVYNRPNDKLTRSFTPSWVPGRRFGAAKPVFILISRRTFSAAEAFAYDLQALKRATVVGERSGGGAHPFEYRELQGGFVLSLPESRSVNPITDTDWEGVGVIPDVESSADGALDVALDLAKRAISQPSRKPETSGAASP